MELKIDEMLEDYKRMYHALENPQKSTEYWDKVVNFTNAIMNKYKSKFVDDLCIAIIDELERQMKEATNN